MGGYARAWQERWFEDQAEIADAKVRGEWVAAPPPHPRQGEPPKPKFATQKERDAYNVKRRNEWFEENEYHLMIAHSPSPMQSFWEELWARLTRSPDDAYTRKMKRIEAARQRSDEAIRRNRERRWREHDARRI